MPDSGKPTNSTPDLDTVTLVRDQKLRKMLGDVSAPTLWRMRNDPALEFPKKIKVSPGIGGTRLSEFAAWLEKRAAR